ncbi:MAG: bifunctional hydroxymethylpyrimidine kinase/phosphomethylpyrimidine kinase [Hyphomonadaceae bacterium]
MPLVLVISSYVAASRVGGGMAPYVLGPLKVDPVHVPTTLFGRHPGWGRPGGEAVPADTMQDMLDGIAANGLFELTDAILTGYFATPDQIDVAARAIDAVRAARGAGREPFVMVDPVMGDRDKGLFVREETARAQADVLVPRADLVACNHWEFERLAAPASKLEDVIETARESGRNWLVSSIPFRNRIANVLVEGGEIHASAHDAVEGEIPKGTGDLFHLAYLGHRVNGASASVCLHRAIWTVQTVLRLARTWKAPELPLAACQPFLANPQEAGFVIPVDQDDESGERG